MSRQLSGNTITLVIGQCQAPSQAYYHGNWIWSNAVSYCHRILSSHVALYSNKFQRETAIVGFSLLFDPLLLNILWLQLSSYATICMSGCPQWSRNLWLFSKSKDFCFPTGFHFWLYNFLIFRGANYTGYHMCVEGHRVTDKPSVSFLNYAIPARWYELNVSDNQEGDSERRYISSKFPRKGGAPLWKTCHMWTTFSWHQPCVRRAWFTVTLWEKIGAVFEYTHICQLPKPWKREHFNTGQNKNKGWKLIDIVIVVAALVV